MEDWGSDACLCWHFPPLWPPPQAPCHFSPTSCLVVFPLTTISCSHAWSAQFGDILEILPPKQPFWDRPGVLADKIVVESSLLSPHSRASFLAACTQYSGDWLFALPIASCDLQLDDEAVRAAVSLRIVLDLCSPHECRCGSMLMLEASIALFAIRHPARQSSE